MKEFERAVASRERIFGTLRQVLVEELQVDMAPEQMEPDTPIFGTGLSLDSVGALEIIVCIEDAFDLEIPDDARTRSALRTMNTLIDLVQALERLRDGGAP